MYVCVCVCVCACMCVKNENFMENQIYMFHNRDGVIRILLKIQKISKLLSHLTLNFLFPLFLQDNRPLSVSFILKR